MRDSGKPLVLCMSGLDPTGGAGIQADIETLLQMGSHCLPMVTSLTVQDTHNVQRSVSVAPDLLLAQAEALRKDMQIDAIKIGLLGSPDTIRAIARILRLFPGVPVIADPVLKAGGGFDFGAEELAGLYLEQIVSQTTVLTPNTHELRLLCPRAQTLAAAAAEICAAGAGYVLLTGSHDTSIDVINRLYSGEDEINMWRWPRLAGEYHGSGCTLASALSSGIAQGLDIDIAATKAQEFTWAALHKAWPAGGGQLIPNRLA
jgi:hydroxymethylpyrimidine/phosphomethylpyrimidine kinase